jgi:hypothetical protein
LRLLVLATPLLFCDVESGYIEKSRTLTVWAFAILATGAGIDSWRHITQTSLLVDTRKHPIAVTVVLFGVMLIFGGWLAHEVLSGLPPSWRDMQVVALSLFLWLGYNALIFAVRRARDKKLELLRNLTKCNPF